MLNLPRSRSSRNDDHPAQPHGIVTTLKRWACGWKLYRLVMFQTASSIEACSDHAQRMAMAFSGMDKVESQAPGIDFWEGGTLGKRWNWRTCQRQRSQGSPPVILSALPPRRQQEHAKGRHTDSVSCNWTWLGDGMQLHAMDSARWRR